MNQSPPPMMWFWLACSCASLVCALTVSEFIYTTALPHCFVFNLLMKWGSYCGAPDAPYKGIFPPNVKVLNCSKFQEVGYLGIAEEKLLTLTPDTQELLRDNRPCNFKYSLFRENNYYPHSTHNEPSLHTSRFLATKFPPWSHWVTESCALITLGSELEMPPLWLNKACSSLLGWFKFSSSLSSYKLNPYLSLHLIVFTFHDCKTYITMNKQHTPMRI